MVPLVASAVVLFVSVGWLIVEVTFEPLDILGWLISLAMFHYGIPLGVILGLIAFAMHLVDFMRRLPRDS
jgi:hypothetical protein